MKEPRKKERKKEKILQVFFGSKIKYNQIINRSTLGAIFPNKISKSFSNGVKFKSNPKTLLPLFDRLDTGGDCETTMTESKLSFMAILCLLMWPPKACPIENSCPHIEHSCSLGFVVVVVVELTPLISLGFLWLALWPPRAWNDGNWRLQVLHSNTSLAKRFLIGSFALLLCAGNTKQLAFANISAISDPFAKPPFIAMMIEKQLSHVKMTLYLGFRISKV